MPTWAASAIPTWAPPARSADSQKTYVLAGRAEVAVFSWQCADPAMSVVHMGRTLD